MSISESGKPSLPLTVEALRQLKPGMDAAAAVALVGEPGFVMESADAFAMMGFVPAWAVGKQNWVYKTPYGEFQLIVQDERTVAEVKFVESVLKAMEDEGR